MKKNLRELNSKERITIQTQVTQAKSIKKRGLPDLNSEWRLTVPLAKYFDSKN